MARITCLSIPIKKPKYLLLWLICLSWVGCSPQTISPTPRLCNQYIVESKFQADCFNINGNTLIQTPLNTQIQLNINATQLTVAGTSYLIENDTQVSVNVLEGRAVIASSQSVLTIQTGQQINVTKQGDIGIPDYYDILAINALSIDTLKRPIEVILPTATPIRTATPVLECPPPENWTDAYVVQSGESLTRIAQLANVTIEELQSANCIDNPNNIQVGQTLRVPINAIEPTTPAQTNTPSAVLFRADKTRINSGECTTLRWDVQNIRQLKLDGEDVSGQTSRQICPTETTSYSLIVSYFDDREIAYEVTVEVDKS